MLRWLTSDKGDVYADLKVQGLVTWWLLWFSRKVYSGIARPFYTFCCSLPENILSLMPISNSFMQKYIHFIQLTFTSIDMQPFASKSCPQCRQMTINMILLYIRDNKISVRQDISLALLQSCNKDSTSHVFYLFLRL